VNGLFGCHALGNGLGQLGSVREEYNHPAAPNADRDLAPHSSPAKNSLISSASCRPKIRQWALARLVEDALALPPHHFDNLGIGDLPLWQNAVVAIDQRED
jgi:hypothetical protein